MRFPVESDDNFEKINRMAREMVKMPQAYAPVTHHLHNGIYIRECRLPAGCVSVGHHQKYEHLNVFISGRVSMFCDDGVTRMIEAPMIFVAPPGRKVGFIHEDVLWLNVYHTDETDIEKLEDMFVDKTVAEKNGYGGCLIEDERHKNTKLIGMCRDDYLTALDEIGVDEAVVTSQSIECSDLIPFPPGSYKIKIGNSHIHGKGIIATGDIAPGDVIAPVRINGKRTPAGRYANHSPEPNAFMVAANGNIYLVANRHIEGCRGGFNGEEVTTDYRHNIKVSREALCQAQQQ